MAACTGRYAAQHTAQSPPDAQTLAVLTQAGNQYSDNRTHLLVGIQVHAARLGGCVEHQVQPLQTSRQGGQAVDGGSHQHCQPLRLRASAGQGDSHCAQRTRICYGCSQLDTNVPGSACAAGGASRCRC